MGLLGRSLWSAFAAVMVFVVGNPGGVLAAAIITNGQTPTMGRR